MSRPALETTQIPIQWVLEFLSAEAKWSMHYADHSPTTNANIYKWFNTNLLLLNKKKSIFGGKNSFNELVNIIIN
jgi:hypothetical protein